MQKVKRGDIKRFRVYLNGLPGQRFRDGKYHQRVRQYGDYLYSQDREKFMVDLQEWLELHAALAMGKEK